MSQRTFTDQDLNHLVPTALQKLVHRHSLREMASTLTLNYKYILHNTENKPLHPVSFDATASSRQTRAKPIKM